MTVNTSPNNWNYTTLRRQFLKPRFYSSGEFIVHGSWNSRLTVDDKEHTESFSTAELGFFQPGANINTTFAQAPLSTQLTARNNLLSPQLHHQPPESPPQ